MQWISLLKAKVLVIYTVSQKNEAQGHMATANKTCFGLQNFLNVEVSHFLFFPRNWKNYYWILTNRPSMETSLPSAHFINTCIMLLEKS